MKRLISTILVLSFMLTMLSCCSKPEELPEYDINDYKDGSAGLSGALDNDSLQNDDQSSGTQKPSGNTGSSQKPSGNTGSSSGNNTDIDSDEREDNRTQGSVDTNTQQNTPDLNYTDKTTTTIGDMVITSDSYDESKLSLPCIRLETFSGQDITSRTDYQTGTITIDNTIKSFQKNKVAVEMRGRGNSTWTVFDKKAYKLKFAIKTNMFGMGEAKKWVLLANALDETMLRNSLAFDLADILNVTYTTSYRFVNLFVNGKYKGVYQLCEQLEEGTNRIDINSSKTGLLDTGYLIESYAATDKLEEKTFSLPEVDGKHLKAKEPGHQFVVKSPGPKTCTDEQVAYIKDYMSKVNEAIFKKDWDTFSSLCDVDSFVNMFLVDEIMLNNDMGYSFYMYKKAGGKLFLGPAWDYDQSCGSSSHGGTTFKGWYAGSEHCWYTSLIEMPQFKALVKKRYNDNKSKLKGIIDSIDKTIKANDFDFAMSTYVYNTFGSKTRWRTMKEIYSLTTYKQHVEYLKTWLTNRFIWMEDQFKEW